MRDLVRHQGVRVEGLPHKPVNADTIVDHLVIIQNLERIGPDFVADPQTHDLVLVREMTGFIQRHHLWCQNGGDAVAYFLKNR